MDLFGDNKHLSCKLHQNELRVYHSIAQHITLDTTVQLFDCAMDFQFLYYFHVEICMSPSKYLHFIKKNSLRFYAGIKSAFLVSFTKPILIWQKVKKIWPMICLVICTRHGQINNEKQLQNEIDEIIWIQSMIDVNDKNNFCLIKFTSFSFCRNAK